MKLFRLQPDRHVDTNTHTVYMNMLAKSIEWINHLSETLRNKCYFIHLYSNFSIIITGSPPFSLLAVSPWHCLLRDSSNIIQWIRSFVRPLSVSLVSVPMSLSLYFSFSVYCDAQTIANIHLFHALCYHIPFDQNENERVRKMAQRKSIKKEKENGNKKKKWEA